MTTRGWSVSMLRVSNWYQGHIDSPKSIHPCWYLHVSEWCHLQYLLVNFASCDFEEIYLVHRTWHIMMHVYVLFILLRSLLYNKFADWEVYVSCSVLYVAPHCAHKLQFGSIKLLYNVNILFTVKFLNGEVYVQGPIVHANHDGAKSCTFCEWRQVHLDCWMF